MKLNVGTLDRLIRILLGITMIALGIVYSNLLGLIGIIPLVSGSTGFCPLYAVLDVSTRKEDERKISTAK